MPGARAEIENRARRDLQFVEPRRAARCARVPAAPRPRRNWRWRDRRRAPRRGDRAQRSGADRGKFMRASASRKRAHQRIHLRFFVGRRERDAQSRGARRHRRRANRRDEKTRPSSALLTASARAASPRTTGTMVVGVAGARVDACVATPCSISPRTESLRQRQDLFAPPGLALAHAQRGARRRGHRRRQAPSCRCKCAISGSGRSMRSASPATNAPKVPKALPKVPISTGTSSAPSANCSQLPRPVAPITPSPCASSTISQASRCAREMRELGQAARGRHPC